MSISENYSISLTANAAAYALKNLAKHPSAIGLRLGVKSTGCSGLGYQLEFVESAKEHDVVMESEGVQLFVDPKSLVYLIGTLIDYEKNGLNSGFAFRNPNERDRCGCGESFRV